MSLKSGIMTANLSGEVGELQSLVREWVTLYRQVMGHSRGVENGEADVAQIMLHGQYQAMTANSKMFDKSGEVAWFDLGRANVRQLVETWASMVRPHEGY